MQVHINIVGHHKFQLEPLISGLGPIMVTLGPLMVALGWRPVEKVPISQ